MTKTEELREQLQMYLDAAECERERGNFRAAAMARLEAERRAAALRAAGYEVPQ